MDHPPLNDMSVVAQHLNAAMKVRKQLQDLGFGIRHALCDPELQGQLYAITQNMDGSGPAVAPFCSLNQIQNWINQRPERRQQERIDAVRKKLSKKQGSLL